MPGHRSTPAERLPWIGTLLAHPGEYGTVTALSHTCGASRQTLYAWRVRGRTAITQAFGGSAAGPAGSAPPLARAILTLLGEGHASYRGVQRCLRELLGHEVVLGTIAAVVREAGDRALTWLATHAPPAPGALALDECYGGDHRRAYLSAVDVQTGVVWATAGPVGPDAESWTLLLWEAQAHGVRWHSAVHDGGHAAAAGCLAAAPATRVVRDVWHVLHRCAQTRARLVAHEAAEAARLATVTRYEAQTAAGQRPRGCVPRTTGEAQAQRVATAEQLTAAVAYLTGEIRGLLAVVVPHGNCLLAAAARRTELETALGLLAEVAAGAPATQRTDLTKLGAHRRTALDGLLRWTPDLDAVQDAMATVLGADGVAVVAWGWRHRRALGWTDDDLLAAVPAAWRAGARVLVTAWTGVARATSAVEGWHAELRPHLAVRRRLSTRFLALLAVRHNHRVPTCGVHAGQSPLARSGVTDAPTDWLTALDYPPGGAPLLLPNQEDLLMAA